MNQRIQFRDTDPSKPIWVKRINQLMEEKKVTQQLAGHCDLSPSVISDWIGLSKREGQSLREPKILGFPKIAKYLGVSVDYLLGENLCETPDDEKIHESIGLSGMAIKKLRRASTEKRQGDVTAEKQLAVLSYLIEHIENVSLLENLYDYLIGEFSFPGKEDDLGAAFMVERLPSGKQRRNLTFKDVFSQATFVNVQHDLMRMKDIATEQREKLRSHDSIQD